MEESPDERCVFSWGVDQAMQGAPEIGDGKTGRRMWCDLIILELSLDDRFQAGQRNLRAGLAVAGRHGFLWRVNQRQLA